MDIGRRGAEPFVFEGDPVDVDFELKHPFQLLRVTVNLSAAATTSELLTIKTTDVNGVDHLEAFQDMSALSAPEATSYVFRFDNKFEARTVKVDYANTDELDITVVVGYQQDPQVKTVE